jgi:putative endonuclease
MLFLMYYVYILFSEKKNRYYIGQTNDYISRLQEHNSGKSKYTKAYLPWTLLLVLGKENRSEALVLEKKIKNLGTNERLLAFIDKYKDNDCRFTN